MSSAVINKTEANLQFQVHLIHPTYDLCQLQNAICEILTHVYILIPGLADKKLSVLLILIIPFPPVNYFVLILTRFQQHAWRKMYV